MQFRELPVDPALSAYVTKIIYLQNNSPNLFANKILPTGLAYLNFVFSTATSFTYPEGRVNLSRGCYIHGQIMQDKVSVEIPPQVNDSVDVITIELKALALYQLTGIETYELTDDYFLLEHILGNEINDIYQQIEEAASIPDKHRLVVSFLKQKLLKIPLTSPYSRAILHHIKKHDGNISLQELAKKYQVSNRFLEKIFKKEIGLSPKFYARLIRFKQAARMMMAQPQLSQNEVAFRCGYYDVSHLHRDFLKFGGFPPGQLSSLPLEFTKLILKNS